ncbi:MAG TPA: choice-of-anchor L domain-containing protein [Chitinophagales bacterium]|nr:choice-of-anchor L domain-containing protein [Chitinophagales bacterium]
MSKLLRALFAAFLLMAAFSQTKAQLQVNGSVTAEELAQLLVGNGVVISNVELDCPSGAYGTFNGVNSNLGLGSGILLTSGSINNAVGPNNAGGASTSLGTPGDPDLDAVTAGGTNDACVLEFDFVPFSDEISFRYVFGSEEYLEYVGSFNDGFALFISGPGIVGQQNIALIPGTSTPVTINNVNDVANSAYYVDNGSGFPIDPESTVQYDGFTVVLTATANVIPCQTYHLKIAVADALDTALDSGVFVEEGSLSTNFITVDASAVSLTGGGVNTAVEGCVNALITFTSSAPLAEDTPLSFSLAGSAVEGVDYAPVNTDFVMTAGSTTFTVPIQILEDGEPDSDVLEVIFALNFTCETVIQTASINIADVLPVVVSPNITIEPGQSTALSVSGGVPDVPGVNPQSGNYVWLPALGLSSATSPNPIATPTQTTTYTVTANLGSCAITQSVTITVQSCDPDTDGQAGIITANADFLCDGATITATAVGTVLNTVNGVPDALGYALHNSPAGDITIPGFTIYAANTTGVFTNDGSYPTNQTLYISSIVADDDGTGFPNLADDCISVSPGYPVVFLTPVEILVNEFCDWLTGDYHIVFSAFGGYPAYDPGSSYNFSGDYFGPLAAGESIELIIPQNVTTSYAFDASDALGCTAVSVNEEFICYKTPIELLAYTGKVTAQGNLLTWTTATETDNDFFTLARSTDGSTFTNIATINGAGTTITAVNYEFLDKNAPNGISYYRLSQTDFNGQTKIAGTVSLNRNETVKPLVFNFVAPVPVIDRANISFTTANAGEITVQIFDITGRIISSQVAIAETGLNQVTVDLTAASAGVYFLTISNNQDVVSTKLVKK